MINYMAAPSHVYPAEPLLASSLISNSELDAILDNITSPGVRNKSVRLATGVRSVDDALCGGLVGGRVVSVSGEAGGGSSEVSRLVLRSK
jgi:predicted ATP-dependent serine protease